MTKKNSKNKKQKRNGRAARTRMPRAVIIPNPISGHYNMLRDPCGAPLTTSVYRGRKGTVARFSRTWTVSGSSDTAYYYILNPANCGAAGTSLATSASAFTPVETIQAAGYAMMDMFAADWRVIGACLEVDYVGTELNRSGRMYAGILSAQSVQFGVPTTADNIKLLTYASARTPDRTVEIKWVPGEGNEALSNRGSSGGTDNYAANRNVVLFVAENMPAGVQLAFRETIIYEYTSKPGLGIPSDTPMSGQHPPGAFEAILEQAKRDPSMYDAFKEGAAAQARYYAGQAGRAVATAGVAAGMSYLASRARRTRPILID